MLTDNNANGSPASEQAPCHRPSDLEYGDLSSQSRQLSCPAKAWQVAAQRSAVKCVVNKCVEDEQALGDPGSWRLPSRRARMVKPRNQFQET